MCRLGSVDVSLVIMVGELGFLFIFSVKLWLVSSCRLFIEFLDNSFFIVVEEIWIF